MPSPAREQQASGTPAHPTPVDTSGRVTGSRRLSIVLIGTVAALILGVAASVVVVRNAVSSPERVVTEFFRALAERDADAALDALVPNQAVEAAPDMFNPIIVGRADAYTPPQNLAISEVTVQDREATVKAAYTLLDSTMTATFQVQREDSAMGRWQLVDGLGWLDFSEATELLHVGELNFLVDAFDENGPRLLPALPGRYTMAVFDPMLTYDNTVEVDVDPASTIEVRLPMEVDPLTASQAEVEISSALAQDCVMVGEFPIPGCPLAEIGRGPDADWSITDFPELTFDIEIDESGWVVLIVRGTGGKAMDIGIYPPQAFSFELTGTMRRVDGRAAFAFDR